MRAPTINRVLTVIGIEHDFAAPNFDRVVFVTRTSDVVVRCNPDTDEVIVSRQKKRKRIGRVLARGRFRASWTWLMLNQRGYTDGFRIELYAKHGKRVFDLVAVCSAIEIREAIEIRANQALQTTRFTRPESEMTTALESNQPGV